VLCLEVLIVSLTLCSLFCYLRRVYKTQRQLNTLLKHFIYHTGICSIVLGLAIFWSTYFLYRHYRYHSELPSATIVIVYTIGDVIGPLALLISTVFQTLLSIRHQNSQYCQKICKICCKSRRQVMQEQPYMDTDRNENQTNPTSHPLNQPSHTYFSVPYTGAFTQVASDEHYPCIGEHTPLMIN
jgi:hypothetical protein